MTGAGFGRGTRGKSWQTSAAGGAKFCRLCFEAGRGRTVYQGHYIGKCPRMTERNKQDLVGALRSIVLDEEEEDGGQGDEEEEEDEGED